MFFRFRVFLLLVALSPVKIFFPPASQFFSSLPVSKFFFPLSFYCSMIFIGKVLLGFQTSPSTFSFLFFSFFFVNFFLIFFYIFKSEQYQRQLNKKNQ